MFQIFYTDLILSDRADKNMDREEILRPFRKWAYFPPKFIAKVEKNYFRFPIFFYIFSTNLILSDQAEKDMGRKRILRPFRKWAYLPPTSKPGAEKNYFRFFDMYLYFF